MGDGNGHLGASLLKQRIKTFFVDQGLSYQDPDLQSHAEEHAKKFKDEHISGRVFIELNEKDLQDLGFSMGHRKLLLKAIKALNCDSFSPQ